MCTVLLLLGVNPIAVNKYLNINGRMWVVNNALSQALKLEAVKVAAGQPAGLGEVGTGAPAETRSLPAKRRTNRRCPYAVGYSY
jgi:succinyl-CoA synthetase beta subunit